MLTASEMIWSMPTIRSGAKVSFGTSWRTLLTTRSGRPVNQAPLLLCQRRGEMQHEVIGVPAQLGDDEGDALRHHHCARDVRQRWVQWAIGDTAD